MQVACLVTSNGYISEGFSCYGDSDYYLCVDEAVPDDATTRISFDLVGIGRAVFHFINPSMGGHINFITVNNRMRAASGANGYVTIYNGSSFSEQNPIEGVGWTDRSYTWNTNPWTGVDWTWADLNTLQIGATFHRWGSYNWQELSWTQILIDYTLTSGGSGAQIIGLSAW